jgi:sugar lactone lactonase YvrE
MTRRLPAQLAARVSARLGEGPVWLPDDGRLLWVDVRSAVLHSFVPASGLSAATSLSGAVSIVLPDDSGGLIAITPEGVGALDEATGVVGNLVTIPGASGARLNDANCDREGRLWVGSLSVEWNGGRDGRLYRIGSDLGVTIAADGLGVANGIGWSPDGAILYLVDSAAATVTAFECDPESGEIAHPRVFALWIGPGIPDGLTVDEEGGVWVAISGGGVVCRYLPSGELDMTISLPVSKVTSCEFGGANLDQLFITTSASDHPAIPGTSATEELAGCLFVVPTSVRGMQRHAFRRTAVTSTFEDV